jgi:acetylornithine deacetylase/succinyl-diaminopimelate desuccinylase-like protein
MVETKASASAQVEYVQKHFDAEYTEGIKEFVRIPSLTPCYDENWLDNKALMRQSQHLVGFAHKQGVKGMTMKPLQDEGRSPFLIVDIAASAGSQEDAKVSDFTCLFYGHMDKQPVGEGWETDPWDPVIKEDGKLYGRGSVDDGYAFFSAILAIKSCQDLGLPHPRCLITIEGSEEGSTEDLEYYLKNYKSFFGKPNLVICLDSMAAVTDNMTITDSLRGCIEFTLKATVSKNNCHSGLAGGVMPDPYQILSNVISRI